MLKKAAVFLAAFILISCLWAFNKEPIFDEYAENYKICLGDGASSAEFVDVSKRQYAFYDEIRGESCIIDEMDAEKFFDEFGAKILFTEQTEQQISYYGYCPKIKRSVIICGKRVNVHLSLSKNRAVVGSPIIYGSF